MDFAAPSTGELAWSSARDNAEEIKKLEKRVTELEKALMFAINQMNPRYGIPSEVRQWILQGGHG